MSGIKRYELSGGSEFIWAVPLSGMGHVADEQPLPYIQKHGIELTPRFGGEELNSKLGLSSVPMPYGYLASGWPFLQRIFNIPRRRMNIYWRNIFKDLSHKDGFFHFLEQLKYSETENGFFGKSPLLHYTREFKINQNSIEIFDKIDFKENLHFLEFYLCPWAEFKTHHINFRCLITPSLEVNYSYTISSSTGLAILHAHKLLNVKFKKGESVSWSYTYHIL